MEEPWQAKWPIKKKNTTAIRLNPSMPSTFFESLDQNLGDDKGFFFLQLKEEKLAIEILFNTA